MTPDQSRVLARSVPSSTGCWIWTAARSAEGYGRVNVDGAIIPAHRLSYRAFVGEIPPGLHLDHLCQTPACVNPAHLEPVTLRENLRRAADRRRGPVTLADPPPDGELTVSAYAALTGRPQRTVRWLAQTGAIPAKKVGRDWVIAVEALDTEPAA